MSTISAAAYATPPALIAVDWGTSQLRVRLVDRLGTVLDERESGEGIGQIDGGHEAAFERMVAGWPNVPAIMAGMVGSRQGWREAAYLPCPVSEPQIAGSMLRFDTSTGRPVAIVPGLNLNAPERDGDVMRGEETQVIGLIAADHAFTGIALCPGTHSKWTYVENGTITGFQSFITGELFALLQQKSFLRHSVAQDMSAAGDLTTHADFALGVGRTARDGLPYIGSLFSVRTRYLLQDAQPADNLAYLSGLTIGGEIAAARAMRPIAPGTQIRIVAASRLAHAYKAALDLLSLPAEINDGNALALAGLMRLATTVGFLPEGHA